MEMTNFGARVTFQNNLVKLFNPYENKIQNKCKFMEDAHKYKRLRNCPRKSFSKCCMISKLVM